MRTHTAPFESRAAGSQDRYAPHSHSIHGPRSSVVGRVVRPWPRYECTFHPTNLVPCIPQLFPDAAVLLSFAGTASHSSLVSPDLRGAHFGHCKWSTAIIAQCVCWTSCHIDSAQKRTVEHGCIAFVPYTENLWPS